MRFSVVVPAFGEAGRIGGAVARIVADLASVDADGGVEVIVVDDGSSDDTSAEAEAAGARVVRLARNRGKGAAVRAGVLNARGSSVAFIDADLAYPPVQLIRLLDAVEAGADVVVGNRQDPESTQAGPLPLLRMIAGRAFNRLSAWAVLGTTRDTQCGCKAFSGEAARDLFSKSRIDGFAFDVEVLHLATRSGLRIVEVPVNQVAAEGTTIRLGLDTVAMVRDLFRIRRWSRDGVYDAP